MDDLMLVAVLEGSDDLLEESHGIGLAHLAPSVTVDATCAKPQTHSSFAFSNYVCEQLFSGIFHHHDDVGRSCDDLVSEE